MSDLIISSGMLPAVFLSMTGSAIVEAIKKLFRKTNKLELAATDPDFKMAMQEVPYDIIDDLDSDIEVVNSTLAERPIEKSNFNKLTHGQQLLAGCAIVAMTQLDSAALQEIQGLNESIRSEFQELSRQYKKEVQDNLKEVESRLTEKIEAQSKATAIKVVVVVGGGALIFCGGKRAIEWVKDSSVVEWARKHPGKAVVIGAAATAALAALAGLGIKKLRGN